MWCESVDSESHSDEGDWRIVVPEYTPSLRDRCRECLTVLDSWKVVTMLMVAGGVLVLPLLVPTKLFWLAANDEFDDAEVHLQVVSSVQDHRRVSSGREISECAAAGSTDHASKYPSSRSPYTIRHGYMTDLRRSGVSKAVISDRCDVSKEILE